MVKKIAAFEPTKEQRDWVDAECVKTNESQATVMRKLIQSSIDQAEHETWLTKEINEAYELSKSGKTNFVSHEDAEKYVSQFKQSIKSRAKQCKK